MTTADIADVRAGTYKGDVDSDLLQRLVDLDEAKAKEKDRLDLFSGDVDDRTTSNSDTGKQSFNFALDDLREAITNSGERIH